MFDAYCHGHGGRVNLGPDSIVAFGNAGSGMRRALELRVRRPWIGVVRGRHPASPSDDSLAVRSRRLIVRRRRPPAVGTRHTGPMTDGSGDRHHHHHHHRHDDVDWAAMAGALSSWDELEVGRYRDIVDWLGVGAGHVVVDVGSGAGGMAAALADAVGTTGTVVIVDGAAGVARRRQPARPASRTAARHAPSRLGAARR